MNPVGQNPAQSGNAPIPRELQQILLRYSRSLLENAVASEGERSATPRFGIVDREEGPASPGGYGVLGFPLGAFVTLRKRGELRGCIGSITTKDPLVKTIRRRTLDAAFHDCRFRPVEAAELPAIVIEHSVLSEAEAIRDVNRIELGRHGVILTVGNARSVFLPEVPQHQGWDTQEMLSALAVKAGLDRDAWRDPHTSLQVFTTQHYREDS